MSFAGWTKNLAAMADRIGAMKRKVCAMAHREAELMHGMSAEWWDSRPRIPLGNDVTTRSPPRFEKWTEDTYWYFQGNRFVSREEMLKIIKDYFAKQAAVRLFEERKAREAQGGD